MASQKGMEKWKQKKWFSVRTPGMFEDKVICEIPANDEKSIIGRKIKVALNQLTGDPTHSFTNLTLVVKGVKGNNAVTDIAEVALLQSYIKSLARRGRSIAGAVVPVTTRDNTQMRVKLIAITSMRAANTKTRGIRKKMEEFTVAFFKEKEYSTAMREIIEGKLQRELNNTLRDIMPMNRVEVRKLEIG
jgi:Ribosomal protein S3AE